MSAEACPHCGRGVRLLTPTEAAEKLGLPSVLALNRHRAQGRVPYVRPIPGCRLIRYSEADIDRLIADGHRQQ